MRVRAIATGFYGGGLHEPNTRSQDFDVPDGFTAWWFAPVEGEVAPLPVVKDAHLDTFSGIGKKHAKETAKQTARLNGERANDEEVI